MSHFDEFTPEGRRILQTITIDDQLLTKIESVHGPYWLCSCGINYCEHIRQVMPPRKQRLPVVLAMKLRRQLARIKFINKQ